MFTQSFGDSGEAAAEADTVSAVQFDQTGNFLATGDHGGRIVIFKKNGSTSDISPTESKCKDEKDNSDSNDWSVFYQFQSHESEFDYLKSLEIEEKINQIKWCKPVANNLFLFSTNDKTIKLWKIGQHKIRQPIRSLSAVKSRTQLSLPKFREEGSSLRATPRRIYANAHTYHINSISLNSDGETFISADDLRINWWNCEINDRSFNIVDMKPTNMEELTEVITAARFHPSHCNIMMYSSSRGSIRLSDTRQAALCDGHAKILEEQEDNSSKSFFSEIIASISDISFSNDGRYIISRDYLTLKIWDVNMESRPVKVINIHEHLRSILCDLYESDSIFDKFEIAFSGDGSKILTGSYSNQFFVWGRDGKLLHQAEVPRAGMGTRPGTLLHRDSKVKLKSPSASDVEIDKKILHSAWCPTSNAVAVAAQASLYLYKI